MPLLRQRNPRQGERHLHRRCRAARRERRRGLRGRRRNCAINCSDLRTRSRSRRANSMISVANSMSRRPASTARPRASRRGSNRAARRTTTSDAALVSYILQSGRAASGQPGTTDLERRQLAQLERDANRASVNVDRLVSQVSAEIATRNLFVAAAHRRLAALGPAITLGRPAFPAASPAVVGSRPALVTIRFDRPDVAYEEQLFGAVNQALERRPDVAFCRRIEFAFRLARSPMRPATRCGFTRDKRHCHARPSLAFSSPLRPSGACR